MIHVHNDISILMKVYTTDCQNITDDDRETTGLHVPLPNSNSANKMFLYPSPTKLVWGWGVGVYMIYLVSVKYWFKTRL